MFVLFQILFNIGQRIAVMLNDAHNNGIPLDSLPHIQNASFIKYLAVENPEENVQSNDEMAQDEYMAQDFDLDLNPGLEKRLKKLSQSNI